MITRIVKLEIAEPYRLDFEQMFAQNQKKITGFEGCKNAQLVKDVNTMGIYFTISEWKDELSIEKYRKSTLFGSIWTTVKPWFSSKAMAWSTTTLTT